MFGMSRHSHLDGSGRSLEFWSSISIRIVHMEDDTRTDFGVMRKMCVQYRCGATKEKVPDVCL